MCLRGCGGREFNETAVTMVAVTAHESRTSFRVPTHQFHFWDDLRPGVAPRLAKTNARLSESTVV